MIKHGKILVPTDFSGCANEAFRRACELAGLLKAEVHLLHVQEPVLAFEPNQVSLSPVRELTEKNKQAADNKLAEVASHAPAGITAHQHHVVSDDAPHTVICDVATKLPADLIVMGRHGRRGALEHLLIGSVTERVVRHAPCAVLVTKPHSILE